MSIELTPKEVDLLYSLSENPEVEIDKETKKRFIIAAKEGFTAKMGLVLEHPITIRRICNLKTKAIEVMGK